MSTTTTILALWIAFGAGHMILSSVRLRPKLISSLGERAYQGIFSLLALATFVPLVWVYSTNKHAGPVLWTFAPGELLLWILYVGNGLAFVLLVGSIAAPSPAMGGAKWEPRGALRFTRHPLFMAIALWAAFHLVPNGTSADVAFFGGAVAFVLIGSWHQDRRKFALGPPEFRAFYAQTPFFPFTGRYTMRGLREMHPLLLLAAVAVTVALRYFHSTLFGP
jgi:uncharacterized membrane protein